MIVGAINGAHIEACHECYDKCEEQGSDVERFELIKPARKIEIDGEERYT